MAIPAALPVYETTTGNRLNVVVVGPDVPAKQVTVVEPGPGIVAVAVEVVASGGIPVHDISDTLVAL